MMKNTILLLTSIIAILIVSGIVIADYSYYNQYGNNNAHDRNVRSTTRGDNVAYTVVGSPYPTFGSYAETIVQSNEGDSYVWLSGGADGKSIVIVNGNDPGTVVDEIPSLGFLGNTTPTRCDIDNNNQSDYVGLFRNATGDYLYALDFTIADGLSIVASTYLGPAGASAHRGGNIVCAPNFFQPDTGSQLDYVAWLSQNKTLYLARVLGGAWTIDTHTFAVAEGSGQNDNATRMGSHNLVFSQTFDANPSQQNTLSFVAGKKFYTYRSDGDTDDIDVSPYLTAGYTPDNTTKSIRLIGDIAVGSSSQNDIIAVYDGDDPSSCGVSANTILKLHYFSTKTLGVTGTATIPYGGGGTSCTWGGATTAIGRYNNDNYDDIYFISKFGSSPGSAGIRVGVISANNMSIIKNSGVTYPQLPTYDPGFNPARRMFVLDLDKDGEQDILFFETTGEVDVLYGNNFTNNPNKNLTFIADTGDTTTDDQVAPTPVELNGDGILDYIHSTPFMTVFLMSPGGTPETETANQYPFTIALNMTTGLLGSARVTAGFDDDFYYNYAVACDIGEEDVYAEQYGIGYNFTRRNVSGSVSYVSGGTTISYDLEDFLVYDGLSASLGSNYTQLFVSKEHTTGVRDHLVSNIEYTHAGNHIIDLISLSSTGFLTAYWRYVVTGTNLTIYKVVGGSTVNVGSTNSVSGSRHTISTRYAPARDAFSGVEYFITTHTFDDEVVVADTSTIQYSGTDLRTQQLFTESNGTTVIHSTTLRVENDPSPGFVQFQNGVSFTEDDVTVETPAPETEITGDGYRVVTGVNRVFYGVCEYENTGTYTQRHYLASPNNVSDYSNSHELTVVITGEGTTIGEGGIGEVVEGDITTDFLNSLLNSAGVKSTGSKFLFWLIVSIGASVLAGSLVSTSAAMGGFAGIIGVLTFLSFLVVGGLIGLVPLWVIILLVIIAGAIVAFFLRGVFAG